MFRGLGVRGLGFRVEGFRGLGSRDLGVFKGFRVWGLGCLQRGWCKGSKQGP